MVKYRMVAHTLQDNSLSPAQRQELLLIRANLEEQPKAGGAEYKHTETMLEEIKEIFSETQLVDKDGRVVRKSDAVGGTVAEFYGNMDLDTLELKGPEQALYDEFADIKHNDGSPNTMSLYGLGRPCRLCTKMLTAPNSLTPLKSPISTAMVRLTLRNFFSP